MNSYQQNLFNQLEALIKSSESFYRQEFNLDGALYWIYNYRLASFTEFERPAGRECRGHMFEVTSTGQPVRLASLPMQKFHNLNECPLTMNLDLSKVDTVELKADGSLMSSYSHRGEVRFKSKGSLFSEQAIDATKWIHQPEQHEFRSAILYLDGSGWTVNLEWCAPHNRIVIGYAQPHLKVLNVRNRETGEYMSREMVEQCFRSEHVIDRVNTNGLDVAAFVQSIPSMQEDIEGYVCRIGDLWFKVKTDKYMSLHHAKDSINNPRRLFEAVLDEGVDDLRSMFVHDAFALSQINAMEQKVVTMYNEVHHVVCNYYSANKTADRKTYAIGAQQIDFKGIRLLGLLMSVFLSNGQEPDIKSFLKSKYKELGFKDTSTEVSNDE